MAAGLDSLGVSELRASLATLAGADIPAVAMFDHPSVAALAAHVATVRGIGIERETRRGNDVDDAESIARFRRGEYRALSARSLSARSPCSQIAERSPSSRRGCTVAVACGGRVSAGDASNLDAHLSFDRVDPTVVPIARWDVDREATATRAADSNPNPPRFGAFLPGDPETFDVDAFATRRGEARDVDPQQRLLLEATLTAKTHASRNSSTEPMRASFTGVAIGVQHMEYGSSGPYAATGSALSVAAGRVSFAFGFAAAAVAVDTACSASLTATHLASVGALHAASIESRAWSIVGGANLTLAPAAFAAVAAAGMLARDGRCKTMDAAADGYGRAETVAVFVLRHENQNLAADGIRTHVDASRDALFRVDASATNQDGRSASLTAPNGAAQRAVIGEALRVASRGCRRENHATAFAVSGVSTHGTGTALGDPVETNALLAVLDDFFFAPKTNVSKPSTTNVSKPPTTNVSGPPTTNVSGSGRAFRDATRSRARVSFRVQVSRGARRGVRRRRGDASRRGGVRGGDIAVARATPRAQSARRGVRSRELVRRVFASRKSRRRAGRVGGRVERTARRGERVRVHGV